MGIVLIHTQKTSTVSDHLLLESCRDRRREKSHDTRDEWRGSVEGKMDNFLSEV